MGIEDIKFNEYVDSQMEIQNLYHQILDDIHSDDPENIVTKPGSFKELAPDFSDILSPERQRTFAILNNERKSGAKLNRIFPPVITRFQMPMNIVDSSASEETDFDRYISEIVSLTNSSTPFIHQDKLTEIYERGMEDGDMEKFNDARKNQRKLIVGIHIHGMASELSPGINPQTGVARESNEAIAQARVQQAKLFLNAHEIDENLITSSIGIYDSSDLRSGEEYPIDAQGIRFTVIYANQRQKKYGDPISI